MKVEHGFLVPMHLCFGHDPDWPVKTAHMAKYAKLVPALALILHLCDAEGGPIGEPATRRALSWVEYLESHARRAYASVTRAEYAAARALLAKIRARALKDRFTLRDIYRSNWTHLQRPEAARQAARVLVEFDYLRDIPAQPGQLGGRPSETFEVNRHERRTQGKFEHALFPGAQLCRPRLLTAHRRAGDDEHRQT
jgi:hypothetical protein